MCYQMVLVITQPFGTIIYVDDNYWGRVRGILSQYTFENIQTLLVLSVVYLVWYLFGMLSFDVSFDDV